MTQGAEKGLLLRAVEVSKCKVHRPGDVIVLCGRDILAGPYNCYCAFQMARLKPLIHALEAGRSEVQERSGTLRCTDYDCEGRFEIKVLPVAEIIAHRATPAIAPDREQEPAPNPPAENRESSRSTIPRASQTATIVTSEINSSHQPFLEQLPKQLKNALLKVGDEMLSAPGDVILAQGSPGKGVFFIINGSIVVEKEMPDGSVVELAVLTEGEVFGEMSCLSGEVVNATIRAKSACDLRRLTDGVFDKVMSDNTDLHRWFSRLFTQRLRATNVKLDEELARGMTGKLSMISLMEIIQTLLNSRQTGILSISRDGMTGQIYLVEGQVRSVTCGELEAEDAFKMLSHVKDGTFSFRSGDRADLPVNVERDTMSLLMDVAREQDELVK